MKRTDKIKQYEEKIAQFKQHIKKLDEIDEKIKGCKLIITKGGCCNVKKNNVACQL